MWRDQLLSNNVEMDFLKYIIAKDGKILNNLGFELCIASTKVAWIKPDMKASDAKYWKYGEEYSRWDDVSHYDFQSQFYMILGKFNPKMLQDEIHIMEENPKILII
jgi:hypothetical protein